MTHLLFVYAGSLKYVMNTTFINVIGCNFLLPGLQVLQMYRYNYFVLFKNILRNYIFHVTFVGYNFKVSHLRHISNSFHTSSTRIS
jgi:hypothetical protein